MYGVIVAAVVPYLLQKNAERNGFSQHALERNTRAAQRLAEFGRYAAENIEFISDRAQMHLLLDSYNSFLQ